MADDRGERVAMQHLAARFTAAEAPGLTGDQLGAMIDKIYHGFDGSRVRDYVPLLVERAVRQELRSRAHAGARADVNAQADAAER